MRHLDRVYLKALIGDNIFRCPNNCMVWTGATDKNGYGTKRIGGRGNNKNYFAHRLSYYAFFGEFDERLNVNHICDNPRCVNPLHLYVGTQADNMQDVKTRERRLGKPSPKIQGERHPMAKLNEKEVEFLRFVKSQGAVLSKVHKELFSHVSYSTVKEAANGGNWKYV